MSNTKHTPTPWHAVENSWSHTGIYAGHKEVAGLDIYDEATEENQEDHEALMAANAAFIVRACNSHEQLVAALRGALATIDDYLAYEHNGDPWTEDARAMGEMDIDDYQRDGRLEAARAALAAAEAA